METLYSSRCKGLGWLWILAHRWIDIDKADWNRPDIARACVGVGVLFTRGLYKHQVWVGTVLSPHLSIGLLSCWIRCLELVCSRISVLLNWCSWKVVCCVPGIMRPKNWFCHYVSLLGNLGLSEDGTERVDEWAIDCDDIDTESKNHPDNTRNLFTAALNAFQPFRKFACMLRSWSSHREKCLYVRLLSGNWKLEVKSEETLQSFLIKRQKM